MLIRDDAGESVKVLKKCTEPQLAGAVDVRIDEPFIFGEREDLTFAVKLPAWCRWEGNPTHQTVIAVLHALGLRVGGIRCQFLRHPRRMIFLRFPFFKCLKPWLLQLHCGQLLIHSIVMLRCRERKSADNRSRSSCRSKRPQTGEERTLDRPWHGVRSRGRYREERKNGKF